MSESAFHFAKLDDYNRVLAALECHDYALALLSANPHTILMKVGNQTYCIIFTMKGAFYVLEAENPQQYDVEWQEDIAIGTQALEGVLEFLTDLAKTNPEFQRQHQDLVQSVIVLVDAFVRPITERVMQDDASKAPVEGHELTMAKVISRLMAKPKYHRKRPLFSPERQLLQ